MAEVVPFPLSVVEPGTQSDADAREQALNTRASCIVEAPAGSGKTGLLVQRYLKLLADEDVAAPEEVLAVTFTRKATAELRDRVLEQLLAAQQGEPLPASAKPFERVSRKLAIAALARSRQFNWQLLEQPLRLNIATFDAVAMQIANALPLLSGSGGPREPVENATPLYRAAARRTLLQLGSKDRTLHEALYRLLLHRDGNLADCETLIAEMLGSREQWGELVPLDRELNHEMLDAEVRPKLEHALEAIVTAGLERALATMPAGVLEYLAAFAHRFADLPGHNDKPSPIANCLGKPTPPEAVAAHFDHWCALIGLVLKPSDGEWRASLAVSTLGFKPPKKDLDDHKAFIASIQSDRLQAALASIPRLPPARYPDEQWAIAKALFFVLRHALAELKVLFARRGECDFTELALAAREALRSADSGDDGEAQTSENQASDLALASGGHLRHLLIDEMQDTSAGQYELIQLLTRSWDGATQTLFLVGDPKQSIYLFRAARIERFQRTFQEGQLGEIQLAALSLTANFRSQAALVEDFNDSFEPLFLKRSDPQTEAMDVHFVAATAQRPETQPDGIIWHPSVLGEEPLPPGMEHAELEARILRSVIERRLALPLPLDRKLRSNGRPEPWRIAVLGHGRKHLSAVVKELQRAKLPFKAIDLDPLAERPEVQDALALTRALLHPADRIAWLAVLHAPWCGLGLADLLLLTGDGTDATTTVATLVDNHRNQLSPQGQQLLDRAWPVLHAAVSTLGRTSLAVHVERTWRSLGGDAALTPEQQTNVLRYLATLREVEADGARVDLEVLTSRLNSLYAESFAGECHIELLTIHKSKGLEWDVVLVPGLERGSGRSSTPLLNWLEFDPESAAHDAAVILAPIGSKGTAQGALGQWLNNLRRQRELAERKRLFYVACTRAQEELHLFAAVERKQDDSFAEPHHASLLKACWPAAASAFARLNQAELSEDVAVANNEAEFESIYQGHYNGHDGSDIALAAEASETATPSGPTLQRLPLSFDPAERFITAYARRLDYPPAAALQRAPSFDRPEGSFAVRAFGNAVHRYLQLLATRLTTTAPEKLQAELPGWQSRLETSLRGEGLPPAVAAREAVRALRALTLTLGDPVGLWILSPHAGAASESGLNTADVALRSFRVDRTFLAGPQPLSTGESCIWIVDFKTTEQGARTDAAFEASEMDKYRDQLETYADLRRTLPDGHLPVRLGLFYPLIPKLLSWHSPSKNPD